MGRATGPGVPQPRLLPGGARKGTQRGHAGKAHPPSGAKGTRGTSADQSGTGALLPHEEMPAGSRGRNQRGLHAQTQPGVCTRVRTRMCVAAHRRMSHTGSDGAASSGPSSCPALSPGDARRDAQRDADALDVEKWEKPTGAADSRLQSSTQRRKQPRLPGRTPPPANANLVPPVPGAWQVCLHPPHPRDGHASPPHRSFPPTSPQGGITQPLQQPSGGGSRPPAPKGARHTSRAGWRGQAGRIEAHTGDSALPRHSTALGG